MRERSNLKYHDEEWTPLRLQPDAWSTTRWDDVARLVRNERGRLLDVGCGSGQLVIALARQFDELIGIDISDARIGRACGVLRANYPELMRKVHFNTVVGDGSLPFADESFDVVVACVILEVVPDVFVAVDEMRRVCKPGGCLVVSVANVCYIKHAAGMLAGRIPVTWSPTRDIAQWRARGWDDGCLRFFSKSALSELLTHCGFVPEAWIGSGRLAKLRRWWLNLCGGITVRARRP